MKIILGITGGVAVYKAAGLCRELVKAGNEVQVILTGAAQSMTSPLQFRALGAEEVFTGFQESKPFLHIDMARWADLAIIAPATANILGKYAHGIADDLLTTFLLAYERTVLMAPAMNPSMWGHVAVQDNVNTLKKRGVRFIGPGQGDMACGESGIGRMSEPGEILKAAKALFINHKVKPKLNTLISAGSTREYLDNVRYISNKSSGKMGFALAEEAVLRGLDVKLVSGPNDLPNPADAHVVRVESADEMGKAIESELGKADIVILAAAVSDYKPEQISEGKIASGQSLSLELRPTMHILKQSLEKKKGQVMVGFAGYWQDPEQAKKKLKDRPGTDLLIANDLSREDIAMESDYNQVILFYADGRTENIPKMTKRKMAEVLWDRILQLSGSRIKNLE